MNKYGLRTEQELAELRAILKKNSIIDLHRLGKILFLQDPEVVMEIVEEIEKRRNEQ